MKIKKTENINFDHVKLMDTGNPLPVVFSIDEGYRRGACYKTIDGENVAIIGVSNVKAVETTIDIFENKSENKNESRIIDELKELEDNNDINTKEEIKEEEKKEEEKIEDKKEEDKKIKEEN